MSMGSLPDLIYCEVSSLATSDAVWNTTIVKKAFCKSMDSGFSRNTGGKEGKSISRANVYFTENTALPFPGWSGPM